MTVPQIVLDTNVLVSALRSRRGASFRLLSLVDSDAFEINVSVPLVLEYEDVLRREISKLTVSQDDIGDLIDYLCKIGIRHQIHFLWRPFLKDAKDDMVLELAVTANCDYVVTYNRRDFQGVESFGLEVIEPVELLRIIGDLP
ncbi:MAG: putative toxin-antitoxin system toxin component, PIN family [Planctomycetes bacterium]|nr:putative toxin-antitoxin system toxin component, PIN family [Planctomycetota bacterium]MBL7038526.1 putative toxin-antitoxin system toxin component, PIN family [Pirellulaceae bacterium]